MPSRSVSRRKNFCARPSGKSKLVICAQAVALPMARPSSLSTSPLPFRVSYVKSVPRMRTLALNGVMSQIAGSGGDGSSTLRNWSTRACADAKAGASRVRTVNAGAIRRFMIISLSGSKAHELRAIVDVGADRGELVVLAATHFDDAFLKVFREQDQHARRRGVAVPLDVAGHPILRQGFALDEVVHQEEIGRASCR